MGSRGMLGVNYAVDYPRYSGMRAQQNFLAGGNLMGTGRSKFPGYSRGALGTPCVLGYGVRLEPCMASARQGMSRCTVLGAFLVPLSRDQTV